MHYYIQFYMQFQTQAMPGSSLQESNRQRGIKLTVEAFKCGFFTAPHHANDEDPTVLFQRELELIEFLDKLGYDEAWIGEHHSGGFECISSPELMIAAAAERTKRIKLGAGVVSLPYHNPLMVANRMIQLDHMTMGRTIFGIGPGLLASDAHMMGIDPETQRDRMLESLEVILRLFNGEFVTKETDWFTLRDAHVQILPFTAPRMEIAVASGVTPSGARTAGRFGLGMLCVAATQPSGYDALGSNWKIAQEVAEKHGNRMDQSSVRLSAPFHIAATREQARKDVEFGLERYLEYLEGVMPSRFKGFGELRSRHPVDFINDAGLGVIGTPADAIALIERLRQKQGNFGTMLIQGTDWADWEPRKKSYELFARFVVPHFRKSNRLREESKTWVEANHVEFIGKRLSAVDKMFEKHKADPDAKQLIG